MSALTYVTNAISGISLKLVYYFSGYQYAMMSIKTVLATVLRQYLLLPPEGVDQSNLKEPLRVEFDIMLKDVDKFQLQIENRFISTSD